MLTLCCTSDGEIILSNNLQFTIYEKIQWIKKIKKIIIIIKNEKKPEPLWNVA